MTHFGVAKSCTLSIELRQFHFTRKNMSCIMNTLSNQHPPDEMLCGILTENQPSKTELQRLRGKLTDIKILSSNKVKINVLSFAQFINKCDEF